MTFGTADGFELSTLAVAYDVESGSFRFSICDLYRCLERQRERSIDRPMGREKGGPSL